ncbi:hypothetical protein Tco_0295476 [Tanacetum coccineum]
MAEENVPAPTIIDDQLVPVMARLPIWKSNILMDLQKKALWITPKDSAHPFVAPPDGDLATLLVMTDPDTSSSNVVTRTNVDYAELIWEEFIQAIKNFFSDMA